MFELSKAFDLAAEEVGMLQQLLRKAADMGIVPDLKETLLELEGDLAKSVAEVKALIPQAEAEMKRDVEHLQKSFAEVEQEIADIERRAAEVAASPPAARPTPPEPVPDPERWRLLRRELLERYAPAAKPTAAALPEAEEVADMTTGEFRTMENAAPQAGPVKPPATAKPTAKPTAPAAPPRKRPAKPTKIPEGDDIADMSSGAWKVDDE